MTLKSLHIRLKGRSVRHRLGGGLSLTAALFCAAGLAIASPNQPVRDPQSPNLQSPNLQSSNLRAPNPQPEGPRSKPMRIVSMNLCTDQLVMLLAEHERIVSVSYLAVDPQSSAMAEAAAELRLNHGLTEEILPLEPDLILAGTFTTRPTVFLLRKLGLPLKELPVANDLDDIRKNIRSVAAALGEIARGEELIAAMDARLPAPPAEPEDRRALAALYWANGYTSGGGTLADASVQAAGFRNLGRELGMTGTGQLPLEALLAADPEMLVTGRKRQGPALANEIFHHPALQRAFADKPNVSLPDHLWVCGTPFVAEAVARLAEARRAVGGGAHSKGRAGEALP